MSQQPEASATGCLAVGTMSGPQEVVLKGCYLSAAWFPTDTLVSAWFSSPILQLPVHGEPPSVLPEHSYF